MAEARGSKSPWRGQIDIMDLGRPGVGGLEANWRAGVVFVGWGDWPSGGAGGTNAGVRRVLCKDGC